MRKPISATLSADGNFHIDFSEASQLKDIELSEYMNQLLAFCQEHEASDLHLLAGARPFIRLRRSIAFISDDLLSSELSYRLNTALLSPAQVDYLNTNMDFDYAVTLDRMQRFRINLMVDRTGLSGVYRIVPKVVPTLNELGFTDPNSIRHLLTYQNGLILVTGTVGSGKTVTLSSLIQELNRSRKSHIITIEDPIEIIQYSDKSIITQREIGTHTENFVRALYSSLREDPDIIIVGELRDLETIEMAIRAAETGHLVIGTLHTGDAVGTLNRILDVFPAEQQNQIRVMVAETLRGVICQRLLPSTDNSVALASELLLNIPAVSNLIRENKHHGLRQVMEISSNSGMYTFDDSIVDLYFSGKITRDMAYANMQNKESLEKEEQRLNGGSQKKGLFK